MQDRKVVKPEWEIKRVNLTVNPYCVVHNKCGRKHSYIYRCEFCRVQIPHKYTKLRDMLNYMEKL